MPTFNPSADITLSYLPKPEVIIPESTDMCMMDITPKTQSGPVVAEAEAEAEKKKNALEKGLSNTQVIEKGASLIEEYDPSLYIVAID